MSDQTGLSKDSAVQQRAIEALALETDTPEETIKEIYYVEHAKLERVARIKTYVSVLAGRRVKLRLHETEGAHAADETSPQ